MKNPPTTYGYIVIPVGDNTSRAYQMKALEGFDPEHILIDRENKSKNDRTALNHIIGMLKPNDIFVTANISNLGRSYAEILEFYNKKGRIFRYSRVSRNRYTARKTEGRENGD